jgi:hypothetical protein
MPTATQTDRPPTAADVQADRASCSHGYPLAGPCPCCDAEYADAERRYDALAGA